MVLHREDQPQEGRAELNQTHATLEHLVHGTCMGQWRKGTLVLHGLWATHLLYVATHMKLDAKLKLKLYRAKLKAIANGERCSEKHVGKHKNMSIADTIAT